MKVDATLHTCGNGLWSKKVAAVRITELRVPENMMDDNREWGELRVVFNTEDWNCDKDGDIYTDDLFEKELKEFLTSIGIDSSDIGYSEYGMQGNRYVSLDVGAEFLKSWFEKTAVEI
jgi:hypothetical protein